MRIDGLSDPISSSFSLYGIQESERLRAHRNKLDGTHTYNRVPFLLVRIETFIRHAKQKRLIMANFLRAVHINQSDGGRLSDSPNTAKCLLLVRHATQTY